VTITVPPPHAGPQPQPGPQPQAGPQPQPGPQPQAGPQNGPTPIPTLTREPPHPCPPCHPCQPPPHPRPPRHASPGTALASRNTARSPMIPTHFDHLLMASYLCFMVDSLPYTLDDHSPQSPGSLLLLTTATMLLAWPATTSLLPPCTARPQCASRYYPMPWVAGCQPYPSQASRLHEPAWVTVHRAGGPMRATLSLAAT